ncbi:MAG TPA: alkyl sulfatase dimerization domain-containing protein [Bacillota bacterium]|jgi:alkyl sulfatase BDS1-like metallo-beta-lactamase superfamily hydrolase|nr:alkyl sulfatase dimerization domain-containing protein [Bacillota bacterium]HQC48554.1 alkyl sulfatase dimerization domain-containing protein [Bacillota bacterium]
MKKYVIFILIASMLLSLAACSGNNSEPDVSEQKSLAEELGLTKETKVATENTIKINSALYTQLDFADTQEAAFATKGLIDAPETLELKDADGHVVWSQSAYSFLEDYKKAPDSVNPSLWENTKNNHAYGLFEVTDGIYQVRGYDMANLTVIESDNGWIVFDPLMSVECTEAAMQLVEKNLGKRSVVAVIISHPHIDHFGGIKGVMTADQAADPNQSLEQQLASGKIPIIVPEGFEEHAISENVYVGQAMGRRATYQYGVYLDPSVTGTLGIGIGMGQSVGSISYISPTFEITYTGERYTIDGVSMEFQLTPGTEAPAEMNTWFPEKKALWMAENCTSTLHNLYTLRGAQVRDGAAWAKYLCEAMTRYGAETEVVFQSHNWPHWGNKVVNEYLVNTAAAYKYINDQTLTYINQGYTSDEISNMIELPKELAKNWYTRQYYGTVAHNSKAVYQKYMGWYDANPVNLNPLTPSESAKKWVEYMNLGSLDDVLRQAKLDFDAGQYQWVAEVTNTIVFADPNHQAARLLCADALEQLGYQAESGTWRNAYLSGAKELRTGNASGSTKQAKAGSDMQMNMTASNIFDYMGILLDKQAMSPYDFTVNITLADTKQQFMLRFKNGVLLQFENAKDQNAALSITTARQALFYILLGKPGEFAKVAKIEGKQELLKLIMVNLNQFNPAQTKGFNIVEP